MDEKSQIQALDCTQPGLPLTFGKPSTRTHDYKRHSTTSLFAALDVGHWQSHRTAQAPSPQWEFLQFLKAIDAAVPGEQDIHLIARTTTARTRRGQCGPGWQPIPRYHVHFTPTSASWLNLVERFFSQISEQDQAQRAHQRCSAGAIHTGIH